MHMILFLPDIRSHPTGAALSFYLIDHTSSIICSEQKLLSLCEQAANTRSIKIFSGLPSRPSLRSYRSISSSLYHMCASWAPAVVISVHTTTTPTSFHTVTMNAVALPTLTIAPSVRMARRTAASKKTVAPRAVRQIGKQKC